MVGLLKLGFGLSRTRGLVFRVGFYCAFPGFDSDALERRL